MASYPYFIVEALEDGSSPFEGGEEIFITIRGKPIDPQTFTPKTGDHEVGSYWNGINFLDSNIFSGELVGRAGVVTHLSKDLSGKDRSVILYHKAIFPSPGDRISSEDTWPEKKKNHTKLKLFKEYNEDSGMSIQDGKCYYKYGYTMY